MNIPNKCRLGEILYPGDQGDDWVCAHFRINIIGIDCCPANKTVEHGLWFLDYLESESQSINFRGINVLI